MTADEPKAAPATQEPDAAKAPDPHNPEHAVEPSGYRGNSPATAGPGPTAVASNTPENKQGHLNPSAPEDSNTTPGSTASK